MNDILKALQLVVDNGLEQVLFYAFASCFVMCMGLYGVLAQPTIIQKILGINLFGGGVSLLIVCLALKSSPERPDAVSHAMVITGLVVSVSATALLLAIYIRLQRLTGQAALDIEGEESK